MDILNISGRISEIISPADWVCRATIENQRVLFFVDLIVVSVDEDGAKLHPVNRDVGFIESLASDASYATVSVGDVLFMWPEYSEVY